MLQLNLRLNWQKIGEIIALLSALFCLPATAEDWRLLVQPVGKHRNDRGRQA